MAKPPLALSAVAIAADGSETTWWSGDRYAYNRPQGLSFRTRIGEGFSDAGCSLPRRIDRDYTDLELYNDIVLVGDDGQIAYEGRIGATPRSTEGGHSIAVQCAGWMAHARDRKFREIYVDRDMGGWGPPSTTRRAALVVNYQEKELVVTPDGSGFPALIHKLTQPNGAKPMVETLYDSGSGVTIGAIYYDFTTLNVTLPDANWKAFLNVATADTLAGASATSNLLSATTGSGYFTPATAGRFAASQFYYDSTGLSNGNPEYNWTLRKIAVYGNHGLTRRNTDPGGFYASDVISNIAQRFCPKLNTAGVQGTTLVLPHIAFKDRTTPFDAFLLLNGPHGYELAVWENKTLTFRPYDLSDYDWQVRMDQPGVDLPLQGDTTEGLANYAVVEFDNVLTGQRDQVSPSDDSSLEDTTVDHPANKHGLDAELTIGLTFPSSPEIAIAFGQSYLNEFNRPKNRGQITVTGHILDRAGHWIQPWMVRAGQTISVVDHPNDTPRLITETSYDHPTRTVTISTDSGELNMVEAVVDYIQTNLRASGLA